MWQRLPIAVHAVLSGLFVSGVPTVIWAALAAINLRRTPAVPWSVAVMAVVLWAYWRYAGGYGPPKQLAALRKERRRAAPLSAETWRLALIGGGSAVAAVWAAFASLRGVLHIVPPADDISKFPIWTVAAAILMGSAVAGIAEETGFRGYMQLPLERAYGTVPAIITTAVIFVAIHLTHGLRILPFLPFFFAVALVYGILPVLTGSNLPGIVLHSTGDVLMFAFQYLTLRFGAAGVQTGRILPVPALIAVVLAAGSVMIFRFMATRAPQPAMSQ